MSAINFSSHAAFIWSVADLLRGDYKQSDYGKVILPFTVLRRLDCVLEGTKPAVLKAFEARKALGAALSWDDIMQRARGEKSKSEDSEFVQRGTAFAAQRPTKIQ